MMKPNSGPIPGANYTSDTKNYPWRQPPEFSDVDEALDMLAKKVTKFPVANGFLTMAEMGIPLYKIADMILTQGVGAGKWTVDFTLLLAGPFTRMIELICVGFGVDYDLGITDDENDFETGTFFKEDQALRTPNGKFKLLDEQLPEIKNAADDQQSGDTGKVKDLKTEGFMAMQGGPPADGAKPQETK
jgi:hypothetical protein